MTEDKQQLTLIAKRNPPGDRWVLEGESDTHEGITQTLQAWFDKTGLKSDFQLEPLKGKLYAISTIAVEVKEEIKSFSIYGDYSL